MAIFSTVLLSILALFVTFPRPGGGGELGVNYDSSVIWHVFVAFVVVLLALFILGCIFVAMRNKRHHSIDEDQEQDIRKLAE